MTTNYINTLILLADDSPVDHAVMPDLGKSSVAAQQYRAISEHPYELTSDDVIFQRVVEKLGLAEAEIASEQAAYFATGRACLRASPLAKTHGWGIHADSEGRIALVAAESERYQELLADDSVTKLKAMRRSKA